MKVYAGAPAAARNYVEADRSRADDYYLTEDTGIARRFTATDGRVTELAPLTGEAYETWVAGRDPATGQPRGQLRQDAHAVRFVEVLVNGPKSWSIAAALHPDVAAAYEAAQDRAAQQILGWLSAHATTRVGPRGGQVPVPIEVLEAAAVRHYTSRAGDPHWHLHLQINARVFAAGKWRGLWTVDVRDSLAAINGIGHAAIVTDPGFNAALAAHGYTRDATGELRQLVGYVGEFSARHAQIARNADRYEREWTTAHPGEMPGPVLRRAWDARAWAAGRPDKVTPAPGTDIGERWRSELADLGFRPPARPVALPAAAVGALDRDALMGRALALLGAARSAWNAADVRGEVERLIAAAGVVVDAAVRVELAEDLTARALDRCVPLLARDGVPEHIRVWTSRPVLAVEADLTARLSFRAVEHCPGIEDAAPTRPVHLGREMGQLDPEQAAAVAALAGDRPLLVVEGAAGAGKTTTLVAVRALLEAQGRGLVMVTPTLKAAKVASREVGAAAGSAARLAYEHGWRWNDDGVWTRLNVGDLDPVTGRLYTGPGEAAQLRAGDLLVVDEAGMLDQDTACALLTIADERRVRVALLGDRHQLTAVGRGGVLDLAIGQVDAASYLTLQGLHRFTRLDAAGRTVPDTAYADLTLAMRTGRDPGKVFDALLARDQIRLHPDPDALREALAEIVASSSVDGRPVPVIADTREQVGDLNAAVRDRLVAAGQVDDRQEAVTAAGHWIGVGDRVVTRRNDAVLGVANRDTWIVEAVGESGALLIGRDGRGRATAGPDAALLVGEQRVLPADYVAWHVELAYATTAHGAQGDTVPAAHVVVGEHTGAASAYVGLTRGRQANTAHLIAADVETAREQWCAVFARDRADLGPAHAAVLVAGEAARYVTPRPLGQALTELRAAWTAEQDCLDRLATGEPMLEALRQVVALDAATAGERARLDAAWRQASATAETARRQAELADAAVTAGTERARGALWSAWHADRDTAAEAGRIWGEGPGRFGRRRPGITEAGEQLTDWADRWRPYLPDLPAMPAELAALARWSYDPPALGTAFEHAAHAEGARAHPERDAAHAALDAARAAQEQAWQARSEASDRHYEAKRPFGLAALVTDPTATLAKLDRDLASIRERLTDARACITALTAEPALLAQPPERLTAERDTWRVQHDAAAHAPRERRATPDPGDDAPALPAPGYRHTPHMPHMPGHSHSGPSIGI